MTTSELLFQCGMIGVGLLLTVGTGLFVASEFALVNLDRAELEAREKRGEKKLGTTIEALRTTSTHLSAAQLGITLTTLLTGYTFEPAVSALLRGPLENLGLPAGAVRPVGAVVGVLIATLLSMLIGELVPKNFALALPRQTAKVVMGFQVGFTTVFKPLVLLFNNSANAVIRAMGIEPKEELSGARSAEELASLVRRSATQGMLDADHATLLDRTLRFSEFNAADVMTPRVRMAKLDHTDTAADLLALARSTGYSRFPVCGDDGVDDIIGVVHVKAAFGLDPAQLDATPLSALMADPLVVPEAMGVERLLGLLRQQGFQIAVVIDEWGGTAGIVTLEDLVEELVGELEDEHDRYRSRLVRYQDSVVFNADLRPDELLRRTMIRVPEGDDYDTVGGFVIDTLDRIPETGAEVEIDQGVLRVERADEHHIERLRFTAHPVPDDEASEDATSGGGRR